MKQYQAVIEVMRLRGGFATLGQLYEQVLKVPGVEWKTKTPFASIRRIVQDPRFFFKIRPGLWALNEFKGKLSFEPEARRKGKAREIEFSHTYYQGLLVEIGNLRHLGTFVPYQDKNRKFLDKPLGGLTTVHRFYPFTYDHLVSKARTIDVTWFNDRKLPQSFFEVEHSTNFNNSLLKFIDLVDFNVEFRIVADQARFKEYQHKATQGAFLEIGSRVKFISYDLVSEWHARAYALSLLETRL
jgi:hypothetical protein